jgi:hypothetical protein
MYNQEEVTVFRAFVGAGAIMVIVLAAALVVATSTRVHGEELPKCAPGVFAEALGPMPLQYEGKCNDKDGCYPDGFTLNGERFYLRGNYTLSAGCVMPDGNEYWRIRTVYDCYQTRQGAPIGYCYQNKRPIVDHDHYVMKADKPGKCTMVDRNKVIVKCD